MAQATWERPTPSQEAPTWEKPILGATTLPKRNKSWQFLLGGTLLLGAVVFLILGNTIGGAQYFTTVEAVMSNPDAFVGKTIRITGAVIGETIDYNTNDLTIAFTVAHIPENTENLGEALFIAANDPNATHLPIFIENQVKPDLLRHEAQAILTGRLGEDGVFYASELLLKCPSRFEDGANPLNSSASRSS